MAEAEERRVTPTRGTFIDVLLIIGVIGLLTKVWSIAVVLAHLNRNLMISPSRDPLVDLSSSALLGLALFGIWRLRKWGAYLVILRLAYTILVQLLLYQSLGWGLIGSYNGAQNIIGDLLGAGLWLWAFSRKWSSFK